MRRIKLLTFYVAIFVLSCFFTANVSAYSSDFYQQDSETLQQLGLFKGTDTGFHLDRVSTRAEAGTMLVRLIGKEEVAMVKNYSHPFLDVPKWASPYIGYLYQHDLTQGISATSFGSNLQISAEEYATFLLRALGYSDKTGDFRWDKSIKKIHEIGVIRSYKIEKLESNEFNRGFLASLSLQIIYTPMKNQRKTLLDELIEDKVINDEMYSLATESIYKRFTEMITPDADGGIHGVFVERIMQLYNRNMDQQKALDIAIDNDVKSSLVYQIIFTEGSELGYDMLWDILTGNVNKIKGFLEQGAIASTIHLSHALEGGNPEITQLLIDYGADANGEYLPIVEIDRSEWSNIHFFPPGYVKNKRLMQPILLQAIDQAGWNSSVDALKNVEILIKAGASKNGITAAQFERMAYLSENSLYDSSYLKEFFQDRDRVPGT